MRKKEFFFSEEKKQKTFILLAAISAAFLNTVPAAAQVARPGPDAPALAALGSFAAGYTTQSMAEPGGRTLSVSIWYPARATNSRPITYKSALAGPDHKPVPLTVPGIAIAGAPAAPGHFPLIILAHGFDNTPEVISWVGENLATKGYVVAAPAFADPPAFDAPSALFAFYHRPLDVAFAAAWAQGLANAGKAPFDHADATRTALIGYSMGGYGAVVDSGAQLSPAMAQATGGQLAPYVAGGPKAASLKVANLKAVVAISPASRIGPYPVFTPLGPAAVTVPTFFIVGSQDHTVGYDPGVRTVWQAETSAPRYLLTFQQAGHNIALVPAPPTMRTRLWDQDWFEDPVWSKPRLIGIEAHFITAFLDRYVKGDATKAPYIDGLIPNSNDGTWPDAPKGTYAAISPGAPAATLWKGFPESHAIGMTLEFKPPTKP